MARPKRGAGPSNNDLPAKRARGRDLSPEYLPAESRPRFEMKDLVGMDSLKDRIMRQVIRPFSATKTQMSILNLVAPKGIILTGPPGTGKTVLAEAVVGEITKKGKKVTFFQESGACMSMWVGESERNLRTLFAEAREAAPSVIFFDEIDGIGRKREASNNANSSATLMSTLLTEMNNVEPGEVLVIAATNHPEFMDEALLRHGRFDLKLKVPLPDENGRKKIFQHYFEKKNATIKPRTLADLVTKTKQWSGSKIETFVNVVHCERINNEFPDGDGFPSQSRHTLRSTIANWGDLSFKDDLKPVLDSPDFK